MFELFTLIVISFRISAARSFVDYCTLNCGSQKHTVCLRQDVLCDLDYKCPTNAKYGMLQAERRLMLDEHNKKRAWVANGNETRGGMRAASNMRAVSYNMELEFIAQCWVNSCQYRHDKCRRTSNFKVIGQNLYFKQSKDTGTFDLKAAIDDWYEEVVYYNGDIIPYRFQPTTGEFTQLIWARTTDIGCGKITFDGKTLICCNYAPPGNVFYEDLFKPGAACSNCAAGFKCSQSYDGLCGEPMEDDDSFHMKIGLANRAFNSDKVLLACSFLKLFLKKVMPC